MFTKVEDFWGEDLTIDISAQEAYEKIKGRILYLNPEAKEKDIKKFISFGLGKKEFVELRNKR